MQPASESDIRFAEPDLRIATVVTVIAAVLVVIVVRAITVNLVTVPAAFTPLSKTSSAIALTVIGVLAASASCFALNRFADRPVPMFRRVAPIALAISFIPDIAIWAGHAFHHTATAKTVLPLMIMHILVAGLCLTLLPRIGTSRARARDAAAAR